MDATDGCLDSRRRGGGLWEELEVFLCGDDLYFMDVERLKSKEGKGEREGRRGGVVETGVRFGGDGRVIEGTGFWEGTDRKGLREGTSDIRLWYKMSETRKDGDERAGDILKPRSCCG